jgi:hypothetical protein
MSVDDIRTVADVRRELWTQGFVGLAAGTVAGFVVHTACSIGNRRQWWKVKTNSNTAMLAVLLGGAMGSFISASTAGKNEVHKMHPVFRKGAKVQSVGDSSGGGVDDYRSAPTADNNSSSSSGSSYQQSLQRAKDREMDLQVLERRRSNRALEDGRVEREQNRLYRRATIHQTLEAGHGRLSDAHGGHWHNKETGDGKKAGSEGH